MKRLIIFNWKMNPKSLKEAETIFIKTARWVPKKSSNVDIIVAPPVMYVHRLVQLLKANSSKLKAGLAAQNAFWEQEGAFTGEIAPAMLKSLGVHYVIIGHSERRKYLKETDEIINKKIKAALAAGLKAVLCVGEPLEIRRKGRRAAETFVKNQLKKDLSGLLNVKSQWSKVAIAYEPIWAISTTKNRMKENPADSATMIRFIKQLLITNYQLPATRLLYGGSVNAKNIADFAHYKEIDGFLVGRASLRISDCKAIMENI